MYRSTGIESHGCAARGACGDLKEPRVDAPAVKHVPARSKLSAPLGVMECVQADDAIGVGSGLGSIGDTKAGELVDFARGEAVGGGGCGGNGGAEAKAVEGAAEEEEVEEEEGSEAEEEEEEGGEKEHDDWFEEQRKEVGIRFWLGAVVI